MRKWKLSKVDPSFTGEFKDKEEARAATAVLLTRIHDLLYRMYAGNRNGLLIVLQGIDAAGKDGTVRNLFSGANPQGIRVYSFKQPSEDELGHDFLWRCHKHCPKRGYAVIFNRSYYEEVTTVKVHPHFLEKQNLPPRVATDPEFFQRRYRQINDFERMLTENGTVVLKFLLHISKGEQKERLLARIENPLKHWKFQESDLKERKHWNKYIESFDEMLESTHTSFAPWHVVPANKKWFRDYFVAREVVKALEELNLRFPKRKLPKGTRNFQ